MPAEHILILRKWAWPPKTYNVEIEEPCWSTGLWTLNGANTESKITEANCVSNM